MAILGHEVYVGHEACLERMVHVVPWGSEERKVQQVLLEHERGWVHKHPWGHLERKVPLVRMELLERKERRSVDPTQLQSQLPEQQRRRQVPWRKI